MRENETCTNKIQLSEDHDDMEKILTHSRNGAPGNYRYLLDSSYKTVNKKGWKFIIEGGTTRL